MYLLWNGASSHRWPRPGLPPCHALGARVSRQRHAELYEGLDPAQKEVAGVIQHGKVSLEEVEPDVVAVEWQHEGHILKAYFNHSKKDFVLEEDKQI